MEDGELIERAAGGDVGAFEVLVARHQGVALRVAHGIAGPDAEDVVQEAFVKAFRALPRFRLGSPFRPWVLRIVANEARNARRRGTRQEQLRVRAGSQAVTTVAATPEEAAESEHDRRRLAEAVASLSGTDREVIALRWFAGLSEAEMAVALGCRPGTVKSRLSRAHDRLREVLR